MNNTKLARKIYFPNYCNIFVPRCLQLCYFCCGISGKYIQIRLLKYINTEEIQRILELANDSIIKSINLLMPHSTKLNTDYLKNLISNFNRLNSIVITGAPHNGIIYKNKDENAYIIFSKKEFSSSDQCGIINPKTFSPNIQLFTESQKFNTCLNRKISIDKEGFIKNCPSSVKSYGKIGQTKFEDVIKLKEFRKCWGLNKNQIDVCKVCEFRYMCTDCRIYIEDEKNIYSKPSKCNYDPYTATFKD